MNLAHETSYALGLKRQADQLHELIWRTGGITNGPPLDVHTVNVLLRGIEGERVLRLIEHIETQQARIDELESRLALPQ